MHLEDAEVRDVNGWKVREVFYIPEVLDFGRNGSGRCQYDLIKAKEGCHKDIETPAKLVQREEDDGSNNYKPRSGRRVTVCLEYYRGEDTGDKCDHSNCLRLEIEKVNQPCRRSMQN